MSSQELSLTFKSDDYDNSFDFIISKLGASRVGNCYRKSVKNVIFMFCDIFENEVIFQDCTLTVFFDANLVE